MPTLFLARWHAQRARMKDEVGRMKAKEFTGALVSQAV